MPSLTVETEALCVRLDVVVVGEGGLTGTEEPARGWSTSSIEPSKDSLLPCSRSTLNDDDREVSGEGEWESFGDGRSTGRGAGGLVTGVTEMVGKGVCVLLELVLLAICIEAAVGLHSGSRNVRRIDTIGFIHDGNRHLRRIVDDWRGNIQNAHPMLRNVLNMRSVV